ncbi:MAG: Acetolactate synthase large subunit [Candidatus Hydrogenedentes bacterium ADurb.Bin101]|jgi:acetolactate synthase-1/2/3 large subunit|nr:MAG: Acetolactate synthase large subunit [Candidatus Hydrogenedentes bacterium ADurb.Bin101]HOC67409.1 biosynthetic-type acetolactate synthase large subunit [Candidatus Hydrogenedentota bacterium]
MVGSKPKRAHNHGVIMSGADMTLQVLADEGVDTIFGYSGGAILPTYDAIFRYNENHPDKPIELIVPANEQGAGFMAAGYARSTGKVGVFMVTSGPGATNSATPIRDCMADSVPVVLICGQVARAVIGTDAFQEAPVYSLMSPCAKHVFLVKDPAQLAATIRTAFQIAKSGRPGPVVIDIPKDVQNWEGPYDSESVLQLHGYGDRVNEIKQKRMPVETARDFLRMLKRSKKPLLYVGGGAVISNASEEIRKFMKLYQVPAVTTLMGIGAVDTTDELCLHMLGMHGTAYANYAVDDCDFLIAIGARFDDRVAGVPRAFAPRALIAHIDIDPAEIGKVKPVDWQYVGDAALALRDLMEAGKSIEMNHQPWLKEVCAMKKRHRLNFNRDSEVIQPQAVLELLNTYTKGEAIIVSGVGQHQMFCAQYFDFKHPRTWISSGSMGTMGFGLPAAVGAQVANPGKLVIDVDGDGSIRMNIGELETCTTYNLPVKVLLLNNYGDGMVVQWQTLYYNGRFSGTDKSLRTKDFVKTAEADGFKFSKSVSSYEDLKPAMEAFLKFQGPAFLEVITDKHAFVYPMVGPGMPYKDMLTGPYIESRDTGPASEILDTSDSF